MIRDIGVDRRHRSGSELSEPSERIKVIGVIGVDQSCRSHRSGSELSERIGDIGVIGSIRAIGVDRRHRSGSELSEVSERIGDIGVIGSIRAIGEKRPLAVGRFVAPSRRGYAPNDCGVGVPHKASDLPCVGGRTGTIAFIYSDPQGVDKLISSCPHRSFGALPLRPTATMRRTSCEVLSRIEDRG